LEVDRLEGVAADIERLATLLTSPTALLEHCSNTSVRSPGLGGELEGAAALSRYRRAGDRAVCVGTRRDHRLASSSRRQDQCRQDKILARRRRLAWQRRCAAQHVAQLADVDGPRVTASKLIGIRRSEVDPAALPHEQVTDNSACTLRSSSGGSSSSMTARPVEYRSSRKRPSPHERRQLVAALMSWK